MFREMGCYAVMAPGQAVTGGKARCWQQAGGEGGEGHAGPRQGKPEDCAGSQLPEAGTAKGLNRDPEASLEERNEFPCRAKVFLF